MQNLEPTQFDKMRIKRASKHYDVSESFLRHALMNRKLSSFRFGRTVYVSMTEIENLINSNIEKAVR
jgi:hypothetical protein